MSGIVGVNIGERYVRSDKARCHALRVRRVAKRVETTLFASLSHLEGLVYNMS